MIEAPVQTNKAPAKPTKDTPVTPADAIAHLRAIEKPIKEALAGQPDNNPAAFGLGEVRTIRNTGLTIASTTLQVADKKIGATVRGSDVQTKHGGTPTQITMNSDGKDTIFVPRRNDEGKVSFVNQATVGNAALQKGILKPQTLADYVHDAVHAVPNKEFTNAARVKPVEAKLPTVEGAAEVNQRVKAAGVLADKREKGTNFVASVMARKVDGAAETPRQEADRIAATKLAEQKKPDITGTLGSKVDPLVLESPQDQAARIAKIAADNQVKPDITGALKGKTPAAAQGGEKPSAQGEVKKQPGVWAGNTRMRGPGAFN
jgi:hypothetical protein